MEYQRPKNFEAPASVNQGSGRMKSECHEDDGPLKIARVKAGITQSQLSSIIARRFHISFSSTDLSRLERGLSWPAAPERVAAVADVLDISIKEWSLFYEKVQENRKTKKDQSAQAGSV